LPQQADGVSGGVGVCLGGTHGRRV
jgi:hypothetical protein